MFKCHEVVAIIMECFARGLGLEEHFFKNVSCCQLDTCPCFAAAAKRSLSRTVAYGHPACALQIISVGLEG